MQKKSEDYAGSVIAELEESFAVGDLEQDFF
jgi:hypothetical protein